MRRNLIATVSLLPTFLPIPAEKSETEGVAGIVIKRLGAQIESRLGEIKSSRRGALSLEDEDAYVPPRCAQYFGEIRRIQNLPAERSSTGKPEAAI